MPSPERRAALDKLREKWGAAGRYELTRRPISQGRWVDDTEYEKVYRRMGHLAEHLALIQRQYHGARELYCERLHADLINALLRGWPDIELGRELQSVTAAAAISTEKMKAEHDAPISFFRDIVLGEERLSTDDWHYLLATCFRVRIIHPAENKRLNKKGWKQNRPVGAYHDADVNIRLTQDSQSIELGFRRFLERCYPKD